MATPNGSKWTFWLAGILTSLLLGIVLPVMAQSIIKNKENQVQENIKIRAEITEKVDKEVEKAKLELEKDIKEIKNKIDDILKDQIISGKVQVRILTVLERLDRKRKPE